MTQARAARCWWLLLPVLLLASCQAIHSESALHGTSPAKSTVPLSVVTLNLWHDRHDWPRRQSLIVAELRRLNPDVILLQEVLQHAALQNQAEVLAEQLGYASYFVSVDPPGRERRYGNAILTREGPLKRGSRSLQPRDDYRVAGWVRTSVRGRTVNVYVVHLNVDDRSGNVRAQQIRDLLAFVDATRGDAPVLIGGDFNTTAETQELASLRTDNIDAYANAHAGTDLNGPQQVTLNPIYNEPARIDLIFAQRDAFTVKGVERILDQPGADGTWASDHFGVWAQLELTAQP
jgi:endonuclease/exonuclease/phosphatase family metal-dependent hydrolase